MLELLFMRASTPQYLRTVAAFFYGHDVPLKVAARFYTLCNAHAATIHFIPYVLGSYYFTIYHNTTYVIWNSTMMSHKGLSSGTMAMIIFS